MWQSMTSVIKHDKCDKIWQVCEKLSVTKCDKCDKTRQLWQDEKKWQNLTEYDKGDKMWQVW